MIRLLLWLLGLYRPPRSHDVSHCPDFVDSDEGITWLNHPEEIENARWFAQGCYELPAAKR